MKTETLSGTMENAFGERLATPIPYSGDVNLFETYEEVSAAGEVPSQKDIVNFVNQAKKASRRQALMSAALEAAGIKKPTLEDPKVQYSTIVKSLVASGKSAAEASALANQMLGTDFAQ